MAAQLSGAILAAGQGQRLRCAAEPLPKPLVEINHEPLLLRQIRLMRELGATPVHVIVNSATHRLMQQGRLSLPATVDLLVRDTPNSMESLLALGEHIGHGRFLLTTVDAVIARHDMRDFVAQATTIADSRWARLGGVLGVVKWRGESRPLFAQIAADGTIAALGERPSPLVTAGIYLLSRAVFAHAAEARLRGFEAMRYFFAMLLESMQLVALELKWAIDIDEAADLAAARAQLAGESD